MTTMELRLWQDWRVRRDESAFEALVRPHVRFLQDFARRQGCQGADADDAVQATLVELATHKGDKPARVGLRAWLGRSLRSHVLMLFRARRRRQRHEANAPAPAPAATSDAHEEVEAALAKLDEESRQAVVLRYLHDLDYTEVAHVLGKSQNACRLKVHRAIARLRRDVGFKAPALVAALPLLAGRADARTALAKTAASSAGSAVVWGGLIVSTKTKAALIAALVVAAVSMTWYSQRADRPRPDRAPRKEAQAPTPFEVPIEEEVEEVVEEEVVTKAPADDTHPITEGKGTVIGTLRFADGKPLVGVSVSLWDHTEIEATTDENGAFALRDEWVADRALCIKGENGFFYGIAMVAMEKNRPVRADVTLVRGQTLQGRLVAQRTQEPIVNAHVILRKVPGTMAGQGSFGFAFTDEAGRFRFDHVPGESYSLSFLADGFEGREYRFHLGEDQPPNHFELKPAREMTIRFENVPEKSKGTEVKWFAQRIGMDLSPEGTATVDAKGEIVIDAPPPGEWRFTVFRSKHMPRFEKRITIIEDPLEPLVLRVDGVRVTGTLYDSFGRPVPKVTVGGKGVMTKTDEDGRFTFARHPRGTHGIFVAVDGATLQLGQFDIPGELQLRLPGALHVLGEAVAEATENVRVTLTRAGSMIPLATCSPDPTGMFHLPHLAPGDYDVKLWLLHGETVVKRITLAQSTDLGMIKLRTYPSVPVRVSVPAGKKPPQFLAVMHKTSHGWHGVYAQIDDNGRGVAQGVPPGQQTLRFQADGYDSTDLSVHVGPDMAAVSVELTPLQ